MYFFPAPLNANLCQLSSEDDGADLFFSFLHQKKCVHKGDNYK